MAQSIFVSGSNTISRLSEEAIKSLDKIVELGFEIIVGDAPGVDRLVQLYLSEKHVRVTVYFVGQEPRNYVDARFDVKRIEGPQTTIDEAMTTDCTYALAIWDGVSEETRANIRRAKTQGKPCKSILNARCNPRLAQSPLANPYHIGTDGDRDEVTRKYKAWLREQTKSDTPARRELEKLVNAHKFRGSDFTLHCWCACGPDHCHAEVIKSEIERLETRTDQPTTKNCNAASDNLNQTAGLCPQDPKTRCGLLL
jgi:adenine-specific DNA-methyltransferase